MNQDLGENPLVLVDGSSYLFRAFHAAPNFTTSDGVPTGTIYVVINMIKSLQKKHPTNRMAIVFDAKGPTFRNEMFSDYKANRPPMPSDLKSQIEPIHNIIRAMGLPIISIPGVEADDVIGTLSKSASSLGIKTLVSTGDKDMAQLVDENTFLINTMTGKYLDHDGIIEKFGIEPKHIIDFLALMGDKVDNIPGVQGVGEKTAVALINSLGSIDDIYKKIDSVPDLSIRGAKTVKTKLENSEEDAKLSYELATIKTDVELDFTVDEIVDSEPDLSTLTELFTNYQFNKWLSEMDSPEADTEAPVTSVIIVDNQQHIDEILALANEEIVVGVDMITDTIRDSSSKDLILVGTSLYFGKSNKTYYLNENGNHSITELKEIFESPEIMVVGEELKYEAHILENKDIQLSVHSSVSTESYVLNVNENNHKLESLSTRLLNESLINPEDVFGKGKKASLPSETDENEVQKITSQRARASLSIHQRNMNLSKDDESLNSMLHGVENPLEMVLMKMESNGVLVDIEQLHEQSKALELQMAAISTQAHALVGEEFDLGGMKELRRILFDVVGVKPRGRGKTKFSTKAEFLEAWAAEGVEVAEMIVLFRGLKKLKTTYTDKLPLNVNPRTGRIHTTYNQTTTKTGRLSSTDPNLQNIPIRTPEGRKIREAFIAPSGKSILALDYSQIELRIMAHMSGDENLISAFNAGADIHAATAAEIEEISIENVTSEMRRRAKAVNFGLIYGMSARGLAKDLGISQKEAQAYIDKYFARYPAVIAYMESVKTTARETTMVESLFGRKYSYPDVRSNNPMLRQAAERQAINAPIQSTAADIIKIAMLNIDSWISSLEGNNIKMLMQVHDELVFEVADEFMDEAETKIKEIMESVIPLKVPLVADSGKGQNWAQAH